MQKDKTHDDNGRGREFIFKKLQLNWSMYYILKCWGSDKLADKLRIDSHCDATLKWETETCMLLTKDYND